MLWFASSWAATQILMIAVVPNAAALPNSWIITMRGDLANGLVLCFYVWMPKEIVNLIKAMVYFNLSIFKWNIIKHWSISPVVPNGTLQSPYPFHPCNWFFLLTQSASNCFFISFLYFLWICPSLTYIHKHKYRISTNTLEGMQRYWTLTCPLVKTEAKTHFTKMSWKPVSHYYD